MHTIKGKVTQIIQVEKRGAVTFQVQDKAAAKKTADVTQPVSVVLSFPDPGEAAKYVQGGIYDIVISKPK